MPKAGIGRALLSRWLGRTVGAPDAKPAAPPALRGAGVAMPVVVAVTVALGLSTQYLAQPFVWLNWDWDEVLLGWAAVVRDRMLVALSIAALVVLTRPRSVLAPWWRAAQTGFAIVAGAVLGELLVAAFDPRRDDLEWAGRIVHWVIIGGAVGLMFHLWMDADRKAQTIAVQALQRSRLEHRTLELRLMMLRNQIAPHFLFNTLATVKHLNQDDPDRGANLLADLIRYLDAAVVDGPGTVVGTLGSELDLIGAYLRIVTTRFESRVNAEFHVPASLLGCPFPRLVLATLVENAIKHGISPSPAGGSLRLSAERSGTQLRVSVADDGVGLSGGLGSGVGLANVRATLETMYGDHAELSLESRLPRGVVATVTVPWRQQ